MLILWCQRRGLEQEIGNVETWGGWGHTLGMLISGGGGCRFGDRYGYMGDVHIMGGGGSFGTDIGYVNIVGVGAWGRVWGC